MQKVCILDYGSGNVKSVYNSINKLGISVIVSNEEKDINNASHLVLPGVGSYGKAMEKISETLPLEFVGKQVFDGKPILGICVGMQVFSTKGFEYGEWDGLNYFADSTVEEIKTTLPKPHIGWNSITLRHEHPILDEIPNEADFYFVHSFAYSKIATEAVIATCEYGQDFPAIIGNKNIVGVQFHPEKSQISGMRILSNFCNWLL
jgi:imidazole glycerol-phosphate synthase subunit HisH